MFKLFTVRTIAIGLFVAAAGGCAPTCGTPVSDTGVFCHQTIDPAKSATTLAGNRVVYGGADMECTRAVDKLYNHVVLEHHTWIDWDELTHLDEPDYGVATLATTVQWDCRSQELHDFKIVADGYAVDNGQRGDVVQGQVYSNGQKCDPV